MTDDLLHFLVERGPEGLTRVDVFRDGDEALEAYNQREHLLGILNVSLEGTQAVREVCLFGADSLLTLCRTHASWLAPETIDTLALLDE